jgi:hypothetical protein
MSKAMHDIMQTRAELLARIAAQRAQLTSASARLRAPLAIVDQGLIAARYVRSHPLILVGAAALAAVLAIRRNSVLSVANGALRLWNLYNSARGAAAKGVTRP